MNKLIEEGRKGYQSNIHGIGNNLTSYTIPKVDIEGMIPKELKGPGEDEVFGQKLNHPIDADGFIVSLSFSGDGQVKYQSRFIQSKHRVYEHRKHQLLYRGTMGTYPKGIDTDIRFRNPSNTNVFYWGGKLLSCYESHQPHSLDPHSLTTLGLDTLGGALDKIPNFAPHFRYDPDQGTIVTVSLKLSLFEDETNYDKYKTREATKKEIEHKTVPVLVIHEFDRKWRLVKQKKFAIPYLNYAHDLLATKNFYILHKTPFVRMKMEKIMSIASGNAPAEDMVYHQELDSKIVLIARTKEGKRLLNGLYWDEVDILPCHIFHFGHCFEAKIDGSLIIDFSAVCLPKNFNMKFDHQLWLSNAMEAPGYLYRFQVKIGKKLEAMFKQIDYNSSEFPVVHPYRHTTFSQFVYLMASTDTKYPIPYTSVVKIDALNYDKKVDYWKSEGIVGEPVFIPKAGYDKTAKEDQGWLLVQVYLPKKHLTQFVILDSLNLKKGPLATIHLKHHVPYGFHGTFTPEIVAGSLLSSKI